MYLFTVNFGMYLRISTSYVYYWDFMAFYKNIVIYAKLIYIITQADAYFLIVLFFGEI